MGVQPIWLKSGLLDGYEPIPYDGWEEKGMDGPYDQYGLAQQFPVWEGDPAAVAGMALLLGCCVPEEGHLRRLGYRGSDKYGRYSCWACRWDEHAPPGEKRRVYKSLGDLGLTCGPTPRKSGGIPQPPT